MRHKPGDSRWVTWLRRLGVVLAGLSAFVTVWTYILYPGARGLATAAVQPLLAADLRNATDIHTLRTDFGTHSLIEAAKDSMVYSQLRELNKRQDIIIGLLRR